MYSLSFPNGAILVVDDVIEVEYADDGAYI